MNTQINDLEKKINDLITRLNDTEGTLRENGTNEITKLRHELQDLINEFYLLKAKIENENSEENSDQKIDQEMIDSLVTLIDEFIDECGTNKFYSQSFSRGEIDDVELSINYDCEVEIESATIDINDYFCEHFSFEHNNFLMWMDNRMKGGGNELLIKLMPFELFELISDIIHTSVRNIDTSINFSRFDDFECEMDSYKKIEVTDITIDSDELERQFKNEFDFDRDDIENIIKNYHNFKSEEISEENNSEENNSEE